MLFSDRFEVVYNSHTITSFVQTPDCPVNVIFKAPEKYTTKFEGAESFAELYAR
jgi:hypothetical protein